MRAMRHPLFGCRVKIDRAREHVKELQTEFLDTPKEHKTVRLGQKFNPHTNTIQVFPVHIPEFPLRWGAIAADALQNFRTALNYIAWELAKWNIAQQGGSRGPDRRTQFPIADFPKDFPNRYVIDIHPDHVQLIETFQPYGPVYLSRLDPKTRADPLTREAAIPFHPLVQLRELSNIDKHQIFHFLLIPVDYWGVPDRRLTSEDCQIVSGRTFFRGPFQLNTTWFELDVIPRGPDPKVNVDDYLTPEPAFDESRGAIWILWHIEMAVVEIVKAFERVFP